MPFQESQRTVSRRAEYKVTGLCCAEEVAALRKSVGSKPGVLSLEFDILNARMSVEYDPGQIDPQEIVVAVSREHMSAVPWEKRAEVLPASFWKVHGRLLMMSASLVLLLAGFFSHWIIGGSLAAALAGSEAGGEDAFPTLSIVLYLLASVAGAWFVLPKAVASARKIRPDMNLLMTVAVIGAMLIGEWFEAATVSFLFAVALFLEQWSVGRARRAISSLMDLSPATARYICPTDGDIEEKAVEQVPIGVTVLVRPGEKIPLDGVVTRGSSTVNQAPITGESLPVAKTPGDEVFAGTLNEDGALEFRATKSADDTTLARIIHLVQEAQSRRAPSEQWVDKFARVYTPVMMLLAAFLVLLPPLVLAQPWPVWIYRGLVLLVIACPCALVISTPVSIVAALSAAARNGVLVKGGKYLEAASRLRCLALDKTGTLTFGHPQVQEIIPLNQHTRHELLGVAASLEQHSQHPLARAVLRAAEVEGIATATVDDFQSIKGKGAEAGIDGAHFWIGSHRFMHEKEQETGEAHNKAEDLEDAGHSVIAVGNDDHVLGLISVADGVREGASDVVQAMRRQGILKVVMLTGDNEGTARAVAQATGVDEFHAELLPEDKVKAVELMKQQYAEVGMVGDGVNDAPAMAAASVGFAMGAIGTDAAIETADIALMSDDLSKIPWLIAHSRRTLAVIKQNMSFALGLKVCFIALTFFGMASLWMAITADMGASLLVIFNALRLLRI